MTGNRDMFNKLNAWVDSQALSTPSLHHTRGTLSRRAGQNKPRFRHFRDLAMDIAMHHHASGVGLPVTRTGAITCK